MTTPTMEHCIASSIPGNPCNLRERVLAAGWVLGPHDKWWNPKSDNGARYVNNARALRYICEDYGL